MERRDCDAVVLFGASGDLCYRKIYPALYQLVRRGLIQVAYRADAAQREVSYGTTPRFLEWFGLQSLDDLPRTQDLQQL